MTTSSPTTPRPSRRRSTSGRLRRRAATAAVLAGLAGTAVATLPADASSLPDHGVDKKGFCKPKYVGNQDCFHTTETHYAPKACRKLAAQLNQVGGDAACLIQPPEGDGIIYVYSPACKRSESQEDCRKRLGSKPYVMQPGHF